MQCILWWCGADAIACVRAASAATIVKTAVTMRLSVQYAYLLTMYACLPAQVKIVLDPWADDDAGRQMAAASMYNDV